MSKEERIAYFSADHARMSDPARAVLEADLRRHYFAPHYQCSPFDPTELVALAQSQWSMFPQVVEALSRCMEQWRKDPLYAWFNDPAGSATSPRFLHSLILISPSHGELVLDMLEDGSVEASSFWMR